MKDPSVKDPVRVDGTTVNYYGIIASKPRFKMMEKCILLVSLLFFLCGVEFTFAQVTFGPDSMECGELEDLYILSGKAFPTSSFPLSRRELHNIAMELLDYGLPAGLADRVEDYLQSLEYHPGAVTLGLEASLSYEHYLRSVSPITGDPVLDFIDLFILPAPIGTLALYANGDDFGGIEISMDLRKEYYRSRESSSNLPEPVEGNPLAMENQDITSGNLLYYAGPWELTFGRSDFHLGAGKFSSFLAGKDLPFLDALRLKMPFGNLEQSLLVASASLENRRAEDDVTGDADFDFDKTIIFLVIHRTEYHYKWLRFGVNELQLIARENNAFVLGDFFPVFNWHNAEVGPRNNMVSLDLTVVPVAGLEVYGNAAFDDINAEDIVGVGDTGIPNVDAYLLGVSYTYPINELRFSMVAEVGYAHYLFGNYDITPFRRLIYRMSMDGLNQILPLTSPYGPGTTWVDWKASIEGFHGFNGELFFSWLSKIDGVDLVKTLHERADEEMAAQRRNIRLKTGMRVEYEITDWAMVYLEPAYFQYKGEPRFDLTIGGRIEGAWSWSE
ncbi:MAG: hypothetical protein KAU17_14240 [Spirochaetales bacterium]|nr:hypothetical protein [Spirochaetales bacterium]